MILPRNKCISQYSRFWTDSNNFAFNPDVFQLFEIGTRVGKVCIAVFLLFYIIGMGKRRIANDTAQVKPVVGEKAIFKMICPEVIMH